jgi:hypothetical protein
MFALLSTAAQVTAGHGRVFEHRLAEHRRAEIGARHVDPGKLGEHQVAALLHGAGERAVARRQAEGPVGKGIVVGIGTVVIGHAALSAEPRLAFDGA